MDLQQLPSAQAQYTDAGGRPSREFYSWLSRLRQKLDGVLLAENDLSDLDSVTDAIFNLGLDRHFDTRAAAVAATISSGVNVLYLGGYASAGDGGFAVYKRLGSTPSPSKAWHLQSADGAWWVLAPFEMVHGEQLGCVGSGLVNIATNFQNAISAAEALSVGGVLFGLGDFLMNSGVTMTKPLTISGSGTAPGVESSPGVGQVTRVGATTFTANFASGDIISYTGMQGATFRDFQIDTNVVRTSGAGIRVISAGNNNNPISMTKIERVQTHAMYDGIRLDAPAYGIITGTRHINWTHIGIAIYGNVAYESSGGVISNNVLFDITGTSRACIEVHCGYVDITENALIGSDVAIYSVTDTFAAGRCRISGNIIENQTTLGIYCYNANSILASMLMIQGNEFSTLNATKHSEIEVVSGAANWLDSVIISGNVCRSQLTYPSATFIAVAAGTNVQITNNVLNGLGGSAYGIGTGAWLATSGAQPILIADNTFSGSWTAHYSLTSYSVVRDMNGLNAADLGPWGNGSMIFCLDGKATNIAAVNYTVTSGGSGCLAVRQNGAWIVGGVT